MPFRAKLEIVETLADCDMKRVGVSDEWHLLVPNSIGHIAFRFVSRLDEGEVFLSWRFHRRGS